MNIEQIVIDEYKNGMSALTIAKRHNMNSTKVYRILKKHGVEIRNKSAAQSLALANGTSKHPTKGKTLSQKTKEKISDAVAKSWEGTEEEKKKRFAEKAKENWNKKSEIEKDEMRHKAALSLRESSKNGSKIEKYIRKKLLESGYSVTIHRENIGGEYEVDIYLNQLKVAIEIDGPLHHNPIFGEAKLQKTMIQDDIKNGLLLGKGIHVIRAKYESKTNSNKDQRDFWSKVLKCVQDIESGKLSGLIEV